MFRTENAARFRAPHFAIQDKTGIRRGRTMGPILGDLAECRLRAFSIHSKWLPGAPNQPKMRTLKPSVATLIA